MLKIGSKHCDWANAKNIGRILILPQKKNRPLSIKTNCGSERLQNHEKVKAEIIDA